MKKGVFTALVTPFNNGEVDYDALKNNVEFQIDSGVSGLLALGTTGETPTLTEEEKKEIVRTVVKIANKKVEVMVGTGTNSTLKTINASKKAEEWGADILLVVTPYYNKPTDDGLFLHFKAVSDAVDIPIVVYNIQSRTGRNIETHLLKKICDECCNIIGVKEASGNICQMMDVIQKLPSDFLVYSGDDGLTLPLLSLGGVGVISVISNLFPKEVVEMVKLLPFVRAAFIETNPIPIKTAMAMKGMIKEEFRLPMCQITQKGREFLGKTLNQLDLGEPII
jgi:4-hydroxy-tetrahydrodipicolinate synthase